jgi:hypothetical protein
MFSARHLGISIPKGWAKLFTELCEQIDALLGENRSAFTWIQVKEKFGSGRFYYRLNGSGPSVRVSVQKPGGSMSAPRQFMPLDPKAPNAVLGVQIEKLVNAAEALTSETCIVCGKPGRTDSTGGYRLTLCDHHVQQRRKNPITMDSPWYED